MTRAALETDAGTSKQVPVHRTTLHVSPAGPTESYAPRPRERADPTEPLTLHDSPGAGGAIVLHPMYTVGHPYLNAFDVRIQRRGAWCSFAHAR